MCKYHEWKLSNKTNRTCLAFAFILHISGLLQQLQRPARTCYRRYSRWMSALILSATPLIITFRRYQRCCQNCQLVVDNCAEKFVKNYIFSTALTRKKLVLCMEPYSHQKTGGEMKNKGTQIPTGYSSPGNREKGNDHTLPSFPSVSGLRTDQIRISNMSVILITRPLSVDWSVTT